MTRTEARGPLGPGSADELKAFQHELDALAASVRRSLGEADARYVWRLLWLARGLETLGRSMLILGPWFVPALLTGLLALTLSHLIETMELGHNLMHGQFNWMNEPRFSAKGYRWNFACEPADWCEFHNHTHHHYANVRGRDRDYGSLRLNDAKPWRPAHLMQTVMATISALSFEWGVAVHNLQLERRRVDPQGAGERIRKLWPHTKARMLMTLKREYLTWPVLGAVVGASIAVMAGDPALNTAVWVAAAVFAGNLSASLLRNVWAFFIIACGHFTAEAHTFDEADLIGESKGQWYVRQILSAANIRGGIVLHVLSGNASHQIEHHIYPDMPSNRLAEVAPQVAEICRRYGVPYNTGSLTRQVGTVIWRIVRHSLPGGWNDLTRLRSGLPPQATTLSAPDDLNLADSGSAATPEQ
jgi:fatty acid desaturase